MFTTVCPRSLGPFYILSYYIYKEGIGKCLAFNIPRKIFKTQYENFISESLISLYEIIMVLR